MTIWRFVATFCYLGKLPFAPGSWGSLGALLLWLLLPVTFSIHLTVIVILFVLGIYSSNKMAIYMEDQDPSEVVIDEVAGLWMTLALAAPLDPLFYAVGFLMFRIFLLF